MSFEKGARKIPKGGIAFLLNIHFLALTSSEGKNNPITWNSEHCEWLDTSQSNANSDSREGVQSGV